MINKKDKILEEIPKTLREIQEKNPLTHCLTNTVTINDCANAVLAIGGSPAMADEPKEVKDFVEIADVVVINIGNTTENQVKAMNIASAHANETNTPVVIDPVGVGVGELRSKIILDLLENDVAAIRGNMSEIKAIANLVGVIDNSNMVKGVDVCLDDIVTKDNLEANGEIIKTLANELNTVILASGEIDILSDGETTLAIFNGDEMMPLITGSGCMLTSIVGTCIGGSDPFMGTLIASLIMTIAGEHARKKVDELDLGTGSFRAFLIDYLSKANAEDLIDNENFVIL
ncbi:MAG: hydroxyethylthiazole kinase [Methanobrevibacter sp.]|uniref:hydroxyethylthiazole kinase n=1 Tax=Methanobrevibacter sp. TaxID=66852 RepID=UPI0026DF75B6|nr:hydroxyethylthiazole kinase [Methanobrevibacter sp.]MDO5848242.1 hydroxyethylthiazole kinase [Methanobrevibacter sp.]